MHAGRTQAGSSRLKKNINLSVRLREAVFSQLRVHTVPEGSAGLYFCFLTRRERERCACFTQLGQNVSVEAYLLFLRSLRIYFFLIVCSYEAKTARSKLKSHSISSDPCSCRLGEQADRS